MNDETLEWTAPGEDGLQTCPRHPDVGRFRGLDGCAGCLAAPALGMPQLSEHEVDAERVLEQAASREADAAGIPDMIELEARATMARSLSHKEMIACRRVARDCEARARRILSGEIEVQDREGEARKWFDVAIKFRMGASKALDVESKLIRIALPAAIERYAAKQLRARAAQVARRNH